ncbi:SH3 domain-containing protein [Pannus brasiliensis CCIBt3594]|uniref:SH3 domain-containing protein n=1 Tax=Pannus brasiliensis CCIBt3594 TaxID=1427578 RepID=A0AAW9QG04_9CHRO
MLKRALGLLLALTIALWGGTALAAGNQSNQGIDRPATLTADSPNFEISVYPKPDTKLDRLGYGLSGDGVTILEQMGVNRGFSWYRVRFDNTAKTEGWIQGQYLTFLNTDNTAPDKDTGKNRYLGNRSRQVNPQGNQRQYNNYQQR